MAALSQNTPQDLKSFASSSAMPSPTSRQLARNKDPVFVSTGGLYEAPLPLYRLKEPVNGSKELVHGYLAVSYEVPEIRNTFNVLVNGQDWLLNGACSTSNSIPVAKEFSRLSSGSRKHIWYYYHLERLREDSNSRHVFEGDFDPESLTTRPLQEPTPPAIFKQPYTLPTICHLLNNTSLTLPPIYTFDNAYHHILRNQLLTMEPELVFIRGYADYQLRGNRGTLTGWCDVRERGDTFGREPNDDLMLSLLTTRGSKSRVEYRYRYI